MYYYLIEPYILYCTENLLFLFCAVRILFYCLLLNKYSFCCLHEEIRSACSSKSGVLHRALSGVDEERRQSLLVRIFSLTEPSAQEHAGFRNGTGVNPSENLDLPALEKLEEEFYNNNSQQSEIQPCLVFTMEHSSKILQRLAY